MLVKQQIIKHKQNDRLHGWLYNYSNRVYRNALTIDPKKDICHSISSAEIIAIILNNPCIYFGLATKLYAPFTSTFKTK